MSHLHLVPDEPEDNSEPEPYKVTATAQWPPVSIPGRRGWWRHCINGQQVDLPHNDRTASTEEEESPHA